MSFRVWGCLYLSVGGRGSTGGIRAKCGKCLQCPFIMPSGNYCLGVPRRTLLGIFSVFLSPCAMRVCLVLADDSSPAWDSASELWGLFPLGAPGGVQGIP